MHTHSCSLYMHRYIVELWCTEQENVSCESLVLFSLSLSKQFAVKPARHHTLFMLPGCVCAGCRSSLGWPTHCCCFTNICYLSWTAMCSTVLRHRTRRFRDVYSRTGVKTVKIAWRSWTDSITGVILSYLIYVCLLHSDWCATALSHFSKDSTVPRSCSLAYLILFVITY